MALVGTFLSEGDVRKFDFRQIWPPGCLNQGIPGSFFLQSTVS